MNPWMTSQAAWAARLVVSAACQSHESRTLAFKCLTNNLGVDNREATLDTSKRSILNNTGVRVDGAGGLVIVRET